MITAKNKNEIKLFLRLRDCIEKSFQELIERFEVKTQIEFCFLYYQYYIAFELMCQ